VRLRVVIAISYEKEISLRAYLCQRDNPLAQ
jgi:hypothetical protein